MYQDSLNEFFVENIMVIAGAGVAAIIATAIIHYSALYIKRLLKQPRKNKTR